MSGPEELLAVQDRDTQLDQLRHRRTTLAQRSALAEGRRDLAEVERRLDEAGAEHSALESRRRKLDADVSDLERRLVDLDRRMRSGEVTATRELTAMVDQAASLRRRRSELEDGELEVMVAQEPLAAELAALDGRRGELIVELERLGAELAEAEAAIDAEMADAAQARASAAAEVPAALLEAYERLRSRLGGIGAARLVGASCGGCHLTLPAIELDRIRREPPDALVTCDQCGRILIR